MSEKIMISICNKTLFVITLIFLPIHFSLAAGFLSDFAPTILNSSDVAKRIEKSSGVKSLHDINKIEQGGLLTIRFEEGKQSASARKVLLMLHNMGLIKPKPITIERGDTLCDLYFENTGYNGICPEEDIVPLVAAMNEGKVTPTNLIPGKTIKYPDISFEQYPYKRYFDNRKYYGFNEDEETSNFEQITKAWPGLIIKQQYLDENTLELVLRGQKIEIKVTSEQAEKAIREIERKNIPNVLTSYSSKSKLPKTLYGKKSLSNNEFMHQCSSGTLEFEHEHEIMSMFNLDEYSGCQRKCIGEDCPIITLFDKPITRNPDIFCAKIGDIGANDNAGECALITVQGGKRTYECKTLSAWEDEHHGTHLTGIINAKKNGIGTVGIDPMAIIDSVDYDGLDNGKVADYIDTVEGTKMPIFVMAGEYDYARGLIGAGKLKKEGSRFKHVTAKRIAENIRSLWVVAAGQSKNDGDDGDAIGETTPFGPRNLGDQEHVIVVTACEDCKSQPKLLNSANFSNESGKIHFVHVAAPGSSVVSTAGKNSYVPGTGTSQATAIVAGLASKMKGCFPGKYPYPVDLKIRLQITASPELNSEDLPKIASGLIDPARALLDPGRIWAKLEEEDGKFKSLNIKHWCSSSIELHEPFTKVKIGKSVRVKDIYRIVRTSDTRFDSLPQWFLYSKTPWDRHEQTRGAIVKHGPILLGKGDGSGVYEAEDQLLLSKDGKLLKMGDVLEIIGRPEISKKYSKNFDECDSIPDA